jgi:hypothetical protein
MKTLIRQGFGVAVLPALLGLLIAGCAGVDLTARADRQAATEGMTRERVNAGRFLLTAYVRITRADTPIDLYIEGDGLAWITRGVPSDDPTPHVATGLRLALADPAANVVYLARPCQFTPMAENPHCSVDYWTGKRFAPEVVASLDAAVAHFVRRTPGQPVHLIGYSGGGALAVLVAAQRHDVASLRTVAGNLDVEYVNQLHHVSPMPESENPLDFAAQVARIPQVHFSGGDDSVVPVGVAKRFVEATGPRCAQQRTQPGLSHEGHWEAVWPALLGIRPHCEPAG